ncbi:hypothetical protein APHAL10511_007604 [Amanita phalloides]|nr:hypothetical protein APHAL10511_007604 [Amanita phalloides]
MVFDLEHFYSERNKRLNMPDETLDDYANRMKTFSGKSQELLASSVPPSFGRESSQSLSSECLRIYADSPIAPHDDKTFFDTAMITGNESILRPESDHMIIAGSSPPYTHSIGSRTRARATLSDSPASGEDNAEPNKPWDRHVNSGPLLDNLDNVATKIDHIEETKEFVSNAPGETIDPSTSSIEDISEAPVNQTRGIRSSGHSRWKIKDPQMISEPLFENRSSSDESIEEVTASRSSPLQAPAQPGASASRVSPRLKRKQGEAIKKRAKEKDVRARSKQMSPEDYARILMNRARSEPAGVASRKYVQFLAGKNIFYTGGDMHFATERTRSRMGLILRYGGYLVPKFDPALVTHIVTDAQIHPTLRALGLKTLDNIPDRIPTVKWSWIASGIGKSRDTLDGDVTLDKIWLHAAFSKRFDAGSPRVMPSSSKTRMKDKSIDISNISQFTQNHIVSGNGNDAEDDIEDITDIPLGPVSIQRPIVSRHQGNLASGASIVNDPLKEFYAKAKAARESKWSRHAEAESSCLESDCSEDSSPADIPLSKKGWTCDKQGQQSKPCPNQDIIDKLQELMELHKSKLGDEDRWRAFSYSKCIRTLRHYSRRIKTFNEARAIRGIGEKTALKIMEIIETGQLRRIDYEKTADVEVTRLFQGVYGAGQSTAFKWYAAGCRTLADLVAGKGGVKLNSAQEIGVKYYSDINSRMPRDEAKAIFDLIKPVALQLDPKLFVEIMGSFRRGKADCGDIDILVTRPVDDGKTHAGILSKLLRDLHAARILTEDLALPEDPSGLEAIYRGLCRLPKDCARRRRIDFLTVPWQSRGAALLYYTGDDIFNRAMRMKAKVMGYSLNQRGLSAGVVRDPHDRRVKTNTGELIASETEEEIFRILEVPWQEPHERVRG